MAIILVDAAPTSRDTSTRCVQIISETPKMHVAGLHYQIDTRLWSL
jgi:hypothetical protein